MYVPKFQRLINRVLNRNLCDMNLEKLEKLGVHKGLKSFEGLSLKQIVFALTDLYSINMIRGCYGHCLHCYANAQPFIKRYPFEDFQQLLSDISKLKERTGANPAHHHGVPYTDIFFDSDAIDCHIFDKNGKKYDFIDLAKMQYKAIGYKPVFDTHGWKCTDIERQRRAETYVKKILQNNNADNLFQINISLNPFNPSLVKVLNSGFTPEELYKNIYKSGENIEIKEANMSPELKRARDIYTEYINDMSNVIYTLAPLIKTGKFNILIRVIPDNCGNLKGFCFNDFLPTIQCIYADLYLRNLSDKRLTEKDMKKICEMLCYSSSMMFTSGRMEKFYKSKTGSLDKIEEIDIAMLKSSLNFEKLKHSKKLSAIPSSYTKIINPDGRVYLYDSYYVIPTDIQFKMSTPNLERPFDIRIADFTLQEGMIDII